MVLYIECNQHAMTAHSSTVALKRDNAIANVQLKSGSKPSVVILNYFVVLIDKELCLLAC